VGDPSDAARPRGLGQGAVPHAHRAAATQARDRGDPRELAAAPARAPGELAAIWSAQQWSPAQRRKQLFARWDECDEADAETTTDAAQADAIDRLRIDAATAARDRIERFVREQAPAGSATAFTADELRRLNRKRKSRRPFEPYAPAVASTTATATVPEPSP
jgi:hypothetical protein